MTPLFTQVVINDGLMDYDPAPAVKPWSCGSPPASQTSQGFSVIHDVARPSKSMGIGMLSAPLWARPVDSFHAQPLVNNIRNNTSRFLL